MSQNETPTQVLPIVNHPATEANLQPLLLAMQAVLQEIKVLGRRVEHVGEIITGHVTQLALMKRDIESAVSRISSSETSTIKLVDSLAARVDAMEKQRDELTKIILAKCVTAVLLIGAAFAGAIAFFTTR